MRSLVIVLISLVGVFAFAEEVAQVAAVAVDQGPPVLSFLDKVSGAIPMDLAGWMLAGITVLMELLMRFIPTSQPRSVFILVSEVLKKLAEIFVKVSNLLDKVVQNKK